jgi:hypothetical protein
MLFTDDTEASIVETLDPPRREVLVRSDRLLEIDPGDSVDAIGLHELEKIAGRFSVCGFKPLALDLEAEVTGVVS